MNTNNIGFEFFPPKTPEGIDHLRITAKDLLPWHPKYFSVTYGAGGSTQEHTFQTVLDLRAKTQVNIAPHISCISSTRQKIAELLHQYKDHGIKHIVALRGDKPSGMGCHYGEFHYARDLVAFIREETGDHFHIAVAAYPEFHPETTNTELNLKYFQDKVKAGADTAITQYFYNADGYFKFLDECQKLNLDIDVLPGIMPITNYKQLARFSDLCGAEIPRWLRFRLESYNDDLESIQKFGEEVVTELCQKLLKGGAPGLHFYALNKAEPSIAILRNLNLKF